MDGGEHRGDGLVELGHDGAAQPGQRLSELAEVLGDELPVHTIEVGARVR